VAEGFRPGGGGAADGVAIAAGIEVVAKAAVAVDAAETVVVVADAGRGWI